MHLVLELRGLCLSWSKITVSHVHDITDRIIMGWDGGRQGKLGEMF